MINGDVFQYPDTNSTRAEIDNLNSRFHGLKIAIIGIGGTGSYILDHVSKTSVAEIHLYDGDIFQIHNAFRAPGAADKNDFGKEGLTMKTDYFCHKFSKMHRHIFSHPVYVDVENIDELRVFDYVFISVDKTPVRKFLTDAMTGFKIPFIDCGMGVEICNQQLIGTLRVSTGSLKKTDHLPGRIGTGKVENNIYATNIQVSDLNCFNALSAVIKWKKMVGLYQDLKEEHNSLYFINTNRILNEDFPT